jgi:hypothetical protein
MSIPAFLIMVAVFCLAVFMGTSYFRPSPPTQVKTQLKEVAPDVKIDTTTYRSTLSDIRSQLNASSQMESDRLKEIEGMK